MNLPVKTTEELKERRAHVLAVDFEKIPEQTDILKRPLKAYDDGKRTLSEMVWEKWSDADKQILGDYNRQVSDTYQRTKGQENKILSEMRSSKIGHLAHEYLQKRQKNSDDFTKQSQLARLYDRRLKQSMPRLQKAQHIIRNLFLMAGLATSVLAVGRGKEMAIEGCMALSCLSAVAAFAVLSEKRYVHRQTVRIKSHLYSWHKMTAMRKDVFYDSVMAPSHMGLCGFIETFYRTR